MRFSFAYALATLQAIAPVASAAHAQESWPTDSTLRLPLRVHLLHSPASASVTTTWTAASVDTMVAFANTIWRQAGIEWVVESVFREEAPSSDLLDQLIAQPMLRTRQQLIAIAPTDSLLQPGWNLFLVRNLGGIGGGMFLTEIGGAILAERGYGYQLPAAGRGGGTLAHELGHSLGLSHETCDATRNIMATACSAPGVVSSLTPAQIETARRQAATGRPTSDTFERPR